MRTRLLSLAACFALSGCFLFKAPADYAADQQAAVAQARAGTDDQVAGDLEKSRRAAFERPGEVQEARVFAQNVAAAFELGVIERKQLDGAGLLRTAGESLDKAGAAHPEALPELEFSRGGMLLLAKKTDEGISALRASMAAKPSPRACVMLIAELDKQGDPKKEIIPLCKQALPNVASDETHFALLDGCARHGGDPSLAWAGATEVAFYKQYQTRQAEERAAQQAEEDRRSAELAAAARERDDRRASGGGSTGSSGGNSNTGSGNAGGGNWSLSLKNNCKKTVKLFLGNKPKFGSGTSTSISANTITSYSGREGDLIWIVDERDNGLSSLSPRGSQRMQITEGCSGFAPN